MALRSLAEVQFWVDRDGVDALRKAVAEMRFDGTSNKLAREWLAAHDRAEAQRDSQARRDEEQQLGERTATAAERSATAAEASAKAAERSNRISWLALFVALGALLIAAWEYIKPTS